MMQNNILNKQTMSITQRQSIKRKAFAKANGKKK